MFYNQPSTLGEALAWSDSMPTLGSYVTIANRPGEEEMDDPTERTAVIEAKGGHAWARHYFPYLFTRPSTEYQKEFWKWAWQIEPQQRFRPRIECEPRGVGKSTHGEVFAASVIARNKRRMVGYVSLEESKASKHFDSIKTLLENARLLQDYPHCRPKVQKLRNTAEQWSRDAIITETDAMIVPLSLQGSSRGWKSPVGTRFDLLILDDIDKLGMSPSLVKKLLEMLKGEILAAGDNETVVLMLQNLIHRESICTQVYDQRADILSDRIFCGPFPLLKSYEAVRIDIPGDANGAKEWVITSGEAYDPAIDINYATYLLNTYGKDTFDRECQQDVYKVGADRDFREWDEVYHVITWSEFVAFFQANGVEVWSEAYRHPIIPANWNVGLGLDWGTTLGHPTAVAAIARPPQSAVLNDCFFAFTEVVLPFYPHTPGEDVPLVSPGRVAKALKEALGEWRVQDSQIRQHLMSHEASAALNTMRIDLKEDLQVFFNKWKPKRGSGVPQVQNVLEIDHSKDHPFRGFKGRPRLYFIVPDEQGRLIEGELGKLSVAQPTNYQGFARARFEMPLYCHLNNGQKKIDDDYVDALLGLMNVFGVSSVGLSREEKRENALPEHLRNRERIIAEENGNAERMMLARQVEFAKMDEREARARATVSKTRPQVPRVGIRRRR